MLTTIHGLLINHPYFVSYLFVTLVGTMPTPSDKSGVFYTWAFRFFQVIAAGLPRLIATQAPSSKIAAAMGTVNAGVNTNTKAGG